MSDELTERVRRRQAERFKILEALYRRCLEGETDSQVAWLARDTGIDLRVADEHAFYLQSRGFVSLSFGDAASRQISLLPAEEVEVESVLSRQGTPDFPIYIQNMISVETMHQSQIQQGTEHSSATLTVTNITEDHRESLETLFRSLRESAGQIGLDEETRTDLEDDLDTGESQLRRKKPNVGVLREVLKSVRTVFEGAGGALAAQYLGS